MKQADSQLSAAALLTRSRLCHRKGQLRKAFASIRLIPRGYKGGAMESFWLLPACFASLAGFVTPEGGTPGMARRQHDLSRQRTREAEPAAFEALCQYKTGRASCRERWGQYVYLSVYAATLQKKKKI